MGVIVTTRQGRLEGEERDGVRVFRGIPFAKPPVGELRFRAPEPPDPWSGTRDATRFGACAHQPPMMMQMLPGFDIGEQDEDCLFLNVYAPAADGPPRPVLVWIHGGAFVIGSGSQSIYDATALAQRGDVVVVTVNYRLGALGFLDLAARDGATANAGILDQIAALGWVRDHVEAFGGDPGNVTIFGESAGGMSVGTLLGCPAARGLFHRAIPQSGACHAVHDGEGATAVTEALLGALGLDRPDPAVLRSIPAEKLMQAQSQVTLQIMMAGGAALLPFQPVVDGATLPEQPIEAVRAGNAADVDVLVGTTRDEWRLFGFMDPEVRSLDRDKLLERLLRRVPPAEAVRMADTYVANRSDMASALFAFETDRVFRIPAVRVAEAQSAHRPDTYMYLFAWESPFGGGILGAPHAVEIPFLFGRFDLSGIEQFVGTGPEATRLSGQVMDAWLAFARSGSPGHPDLPEWPRYEPARRATMVLGPECHVVDDPAGDERELWAGVL